MSITTGFKSQVIFLGLPISPIYITGDVALTSFSISPPLIRGLSLNTTSGVVSGMGTGDVATRTYQITGTNSFGSVSGSFTLVIKGSGYCNPVIPSSFGCECPWSVCLLHSANERLQSIPDGVVLLNGLHCLQHGRQTGLGGRLQQGA